VLNSFTCQSCDVSKPTESFKRSSTAKRGHRAVCKECDSVANTAWRKNNKDKKDEKDKEWKKQNPSKVKNSYYKYNLKRKFNLSEQDYEQMLTSQEGCCAICRQTYCSTGYRFAVDHCHVTGKIRGLLCQACNTGIGKLKDNVDLLKRAIEYLEKDQALKITQSKGK